MTPAACQNENNSKEERGTVMTKGNNIINYESLRPLRVTWGQHSNQIIPVFTVIVAIKVGNRL